VLFLDEPTTGLDVYSRRELWDVISGLVADGTTVLLTTQYLEEADHLADHIVVIDRGSVIAAGTASELKGRIGSTVVELGFADAAEARRAASLVARCCVRSPEVDGSLVHFDVADGPRLLVDALRALDGEGLVPDTLNVREPTLDDVFLTLTGRRVEPADAETDTETRGAA
jgi:ABC-2 type transport system ATP-binding protein